MHADHPATGSILHACSHPIACSLVPLGTFPAEMPCRARVHPPWFGQSRARPPGNRSPGSFCDPPNVRPQAGGRAMRFEVLAQAHSTAWRSPAHVDHDRARVGTLIGAFDEDPREDAHLAPPAPAVVQRLVRAMLPVRVGLDPLAARPSPSRHRKPLR